MMITRMAVCLLWACCLWSELLADEPPSSEDGSNAAKGSTNAYESRTICGWTVHVSRLLLSEKAEPTGTALGLLEKQLERIVATVPESSIAKLQEVPLWISPAYAEFGERAEYHPDADWLKAHGRDPALAKSVEFSNVLIFEPESRRMPLFVLHELAHAYHDRVLGFDHAEIVKHYERAKSSGSYDRVERQDSEGRRSLDRAYALSSPQEYFAECTEAFFGANDFFPFNGEQLLEHDPAMYRLLEKLWGVEAR